MSSTDTADECEDLVSLTKDLTRRDLKKKRKKNHFDINTKTTILNLYKLGLIHNPDLLKKKIAAEVANRVGVSTSSVYRVIREYNTTNSFSPPQTNQNRKNTFNSMDNATKQAIKLKVQQFLSTNSQVHHTIETLVREVNRDPNLPNFKRTTFLKLLNLLKFKFTKRGRNSVLLDTSTTDCDSSSEDLKKEIIPSVPELVLIKEESGEIYIKQEPEERIYIKEEPLMFSEQLEEQINIKQEPIYFKEYNIKEESETILCI
ncbi:unnamed protein product [Brassicogethes aeneus]|uniref:Uncharacterized protein n=1 Tax=Brassicogethes aeneus TaxID=1431903 RepID=A0A9P0FFD1_BRAAE|nr:unnamed protein product [Brassicogethes aeneus]